VRHLPLIARLVGCPRTHPVRSRASCTRPVGGANDAPCTDKHEVLEDILRFERWCIGDMDKHVVGEQEEGRERAPHVQEQEGQGDEPAPPEEEP